MMCTKLTNHPLYNKNISCTVSACSMPLFTQDTLFCSQCIFTLILILITLQLPPIMLLHHVHYYLKIRNSNISLTISIRFSFGILRTICTIFSIGIYYNFKKARFQTVHFKIQIHTVILLFNWKQVSFFLIFFGVFQNYILINLRNFKILEFSSFKVFQFFLTHICIKYNY